HGEAAWANAHWGWRFGAKHFNYSGKVAKVRLGLGYIPGKTRTTIQLTDLQLLDNRVDPLRFPELRVNNGRLKIQGLLHPGEYFRYTGGQDGEVFDQNWQLLRKVNVTADAFIVPEGQS